MTSWLIISHYILVTASSFDLKGQCTQAYIHDTTKETKVKTISLKSLFESRRRTALFALRWISWQMIQQYTVTTQSKRARKDTSCSGTYCISLAEFPPQNLRRPAEWHGVSLNMESTVLIAWICHWGVLLLFQDWKRDLTHNPEVCVKAIGDTKCC